MNHLMTTALDIKGPWDAILILVGIGVGCLAGAALHAMFTRRSIAGARIEADSILKDARAEAESTARKIEVEGEQKAREHREAVDREVQESLAELKKGQERASKREEVIDKRFADMERRESKLEQRDASSQALLKKAEEKAAEVESQHDVLLERLSEVSGLSEEDARDAYMKEIREEFALEANHLSRQILEKAENDARQEAREITLMAIQRYAAENVSESTVRTIKIPSDDMKGRVIGREGRNIRAIERATGADVLVDDTPGVISISCFDPIRRAIAAESLQRLVTDGRVHPS